MSHQLITVIGPAASGKTTVSQFLARALSIPLVDADLFETNPFLPAYIQDQSRWSFATELFFTLARIKKLSILPRLLQKSSVIVDSGLIMSEAVYTKNHLVQGTMTAAEWEFFNQIVSGYAANIPQPNLVIHLLATPATQLKRISSRGRSFESGYTLDYLQNITDRLTEYAASLANVTSPLLVPFDSEQHNVLRPSGQKALLSLLSTLLRTPTSQQ